ncbi:polyprenyl synthetase family protein [Streptococcus gallolyticus subsp. gallolyticus]|uniref:polyprenyl synthetase family protein n=1 Tax=Streptococcus gallolyticus TaxID=315405 RepID=UPI0020014D2B|nr:farnesyl diphosphate synthase [Streptococcus gallolyticus]MCY7155078.1 polyprenyl synthetase family protein [Streptococcus gallolyticus subsp. gallolyticus]MCY7173025.1 polyprenyl synthetase family protein [Streptococcus gallolyticus subsp. gallolyticus]MCY7177196.1 polyprenyl synthetase family protein [Streptococcus gallolyticus subsp. gallolyticus]MCY7181078.1 polyprenyl synthetase family protein [Streptococcus gallolyticus subsp. gallolyticus]MCY7198791.1 polyprenyl synthetase family pro
MDKLNEINQAIRRYYAQSDVVSPELIEAILYSVEAGGKRIRPLIFLEILEGFGIELTEGHFDVAAALEMIHTGSLIHDDLPAMDDDDYRRGRLTNHKKFDEATAILAGDSLFLDPFGLVANAALSADTKVCLIAELSQASGTYGMVGGQMLDMKGEERKLNLSELQMIHANKTGKLLTFPVVAAGIVANLAPDDLKSLREAGSLVGLAFQVRDDILDVTATFEEIGKTPKKDLLADKATYPSLLGLEKSYDILNQSIDQALAIFQKLSETQAFNAGKITEMIERLRLNA